MRAFNDKLFGAGTPTNAEIVAAIEALACRIGLTTPAAGAFTTITASSTVTGLNREIFKTADADSPLTVDQCSGTIVSNYGMTDADCTIALPTAVAGLAFVLILPAVRAKFFKLQADTNDLIILDGVAGSDNGLVGVASGYAARAAISFLAFKDTDGGYDWLASTIKGTWVAS